MAYVDITQAGLTLLTDAVTGLIILRMCISYMKESTWKFVEFSKWSGTCDVSKCVAK